MGQTKKTDFDTRITEIKYKMLDTSCLVETSDFDTKITEIENKISDITDLVKQLIMILNYITLVIEELQIKQNNQGMKLNQMNKYVLKQNECMICQKKFN